ncbi:uncharacterized protein LOC121836779 [Ixodes scapularis]|uniref:uncharacterized protein LOC121836779 n=1 Tax=Ixodes scapularis TaxID=6945 RepID=UPI001C38BF52|nr:uncharacterized protein LOC121836779 [Ixodes scapularis]
MGDTREIAVKIVLVNIIGRQVFIRHEARWEPSFVLRFSVVLDHGLKVILSVDLPVKAPILGKYDCPIPPQLLYTRSTPLEDGRCPSELLMERRIRSRLPNFKPAVPKPARKHTQDNTKGCLLRPLREGDVVRLRDKGQRVTKGQVCPLRNVAPRSSLVVTQDGREYLRNREHLRPTNEELMSSVYFEEHLEDSPSCGLTSIQAAPAALTPTVQYDDPAITTTVATSTRTPTSSPAAVNSAARTEDDRASELGPCVARTSTRTVRRPQRLNYDQNFQQQA